MSSGAEEGLSTRVALRVTSRIADRHERRLALQYEVTRILSESIDFIESSKKIFRITREHLEWEVGALWSVDREAQVLRCVDFTQGPFIEVKGFEQLTRDTVFENGIGLPGRNLGKRRAYSHSKHRRRHKLLAGSCGTARRSPWRVWFSYTPKRRGSGRA